MARTGLAISRKSHAVTYDFFLNYQNILWHSCLSSDDYVNTLTQNTEVCLTAVCNILNCICNSITIILLFR